MPNALTTVVQSSEKYLVGHPSQNGAWWDGERYWLVYFDRAPGGSSWIRCRHGASLDALQLSSVDSGNTDVEGRKYGCVFGFVGAQAYVWIIHSNGSNAPLKLRRHALTPTGLGTGTEITLASALDYRISGLTYEGTGSQVTALLCCFSAHEEPTRTPTLRVSPDLATVEDAGVIGSEIYSLAEHARQYRLSDGYVILFVDHGESGSLPTDIDGRMRERRKTLYGDAWGPEITVEGTVAGSGTLDGDFRDQNRAIDTSHAGQQDLVQTDDGRVWCLYVDNTDQVRGNWGTMKLNVRGAALTDGWTSVSRDVGDGRTAHHVALSTNGEDIWALWLQADDNTEANWNEVWSRRYDVSSGAWDAPVLVGEATAGANAYRICTQVRAHGGELPYLLSEEITASSYRLRAGSLSIPVTPNDGDGPYAFASRAEAERLFAPGEAERYYAEGAAYPPPVVDGPAAAGARGYVLRGGVLVPVREFRVSGSVLVPLGGVPPVAVPTTATVSLVAVPASVEVPGQVVVRATTGGTYATGGRLRLYRAADDTLVSGSEVVGVAAGQTVDLTTLVVGEVGPETYYAVLDQTGAPDATSAAVTVTGTAPADTVGPVWQALPDVTGVAGDPDVILDLPSYVSDDSGAPPVITLVGTYPDVTLDNGDLVVSRSSVVSDTVTVRATDAAGNASTATLSRVVTAANRAPVWQAIDDLSTAVNGGPVTRDLKPLVSDPDGDPVTITLVAPPAGVTIADGVVTLSDTAELAQAQVTARASDGDLSTDATFWVSVGPDVTAPPVPQDVVATAGTGSASLSWPAVAAGDLAGYRVYRRAAGSSDAWVAQGDRVNPAFSQSGLAAGVALEYAVASRDTEGNESARSAPAAVTPLAVGEVTRTATTVDGARAPGLVLGDVVELVGVPEAGTFDVRSADDDSSILRTDGGRVIAPLDQLGPETQTTTHQAQDRGVVVDWHSVWVPYTTAGDRLTILDLHGTGNHDHDGRPIVDTATGAFERPSRHLYGSSNEIDPTMTSGDVRVRYRPVTGPLRLVRRVEPIELADPTDPALPRALTTAYTRPEWWGGVANAPAWAPDTAIPAPGTLPPLNGFVDGDAAVNWAAVVAERLAAETGQVHTVVVDGLFGFRLLYGRTGVDYQGPSGVRSTRLDAVREGVIQHPHEPFLRIYTLPPVDPAYRLAQQPHMLLRKNKEAPFGLGHGPQRAKVYATHLEHDGNVEGWDAFFRNGAWRNASGSDPVFYTQAYAIIRNGTNGNGYGSHFGYDDAQDGTAVACLRNVHFHSVANNAFNSNSALAYEGGDWLGGPSVTNHSNYNAGTGGDPGHPDHVTAPSLRVTDPAQFVDGFEIYGDQYASPWEQNQGRFKNVVVGGVDVGGVTRYVESTRYPWQDAFESSMNGRWEDIDYTSFDAGEPMSVRGIVNGRAAHGDYKEVDGVVFNYDPANGGVIPGNASIWVYRGGPLYKRGVVFRFAPDGQTPPDGPFQLFRSTAFSQHRRQRVRVDGLTSDAALVSLLPQEATEVYYSGWVVDGADVAGASGIGKWKVGGGVGEHVLLLRGMDYRPDTSVGLQIDVQSDHTNAEHAAAGSNVRVFIDACPKLGGSSQPIQSLGSLFNHSHWGGETEVYVRGSPMPERFWDDHAPYSGRIFVENATVRETGQAPTGFPLIPLGVTFPE